MIKIHTNLKLLAVGSLAALMGGCASMVSGTTQTIYVQALDQKTNQRIPNAHCVIRDSKNNTYAINGNPGSILISKGQGALHTQCKAPGYVQNAVGTGPTFDAWTIGNIIFPLGVVVDVVTGAVQKYPDHITVLMVKAAKK
ncbi:MAG: hypothetical protein JSR33_12860 [Proteobacteria bacterium]|nr:hypothetical protein [Pseudomonadota bacterium]